MKMASHKSIHVQQRDAFFQDPFFKDSWTDFDEAVQHILDKFDQKGLQVNADSRAQSHDLYRAIRDSKIDKDLYAAQAVQVTEMDGKFSVVMDVKEFNPREMQVRAVDDHIVVEGRYEKLSEDGSSSSQKSFYKEFSFPPSADFDQITSALSKDGVLTVRAPIKDSDANAGDPNKKSSSSTSKTEECFSKQTANGGITSKSSTSRSVFQSSSNVASNAEGLDSLPKELREKLMFSNSPFTSSRTSSSSSPTPSDMSDTSRCSSTGVFHDIGPRPQMPRSEVSFNNSNIPPSFANENGPVVGGFTKRSAGLGLGGSNKTVSVTEENGRRVFTSQSSQMVEEKDGFMEHRETEAEITEKESQAARREATTRYAVNQDDPDGRFKKSESADAAEVSETCVQHLPDGSTRSVKKGSSSTSSVKQSFSSNLSSGPNSAFGSDFFSGFDLPSGFGAEPHPLRPQFSTDSMSSNFSSRPGFSDMPTFSSFGIRPFADFPNMSSDDTTTVGGTSSSRVFKSSSSSSSTSQSSFSSPFDPRR